MMNMELIIERANHLVESRVEYETTHIDAGDNYAHLAGEGDFDYHNGESRLAEYCAEMGLDITGLDMDRLAEDVIFWGYMTTGQDFDPKKRFLISSYQVGEIETEISAEDLGLGRISLEVVAELNRQCDAYFTPGVKSLGTECDYCYAYIQTDSYWDMVCDLDVIRDLISAMKEGDN